MKKTNLLFMVLVAVSALPVMASLGGSALLEHQNPLGDAAAFSGGGSASTPVSLSSGSTPPPSANSGERDLPKVVLPKKSYLSALKNAAARATNCAARKAHCAAVVAAPVAAVYLVCKAVPTALEAAEKIAAGKCPLEETNKDSDVRISAKNGFTARFRGRMINIPSTVLAAAGVCAYAGKHMVKLSNISQMWQSAVKGLFRIG